MTEDQIKSLEARFPEGIPAWIKALPTEYEATQMMALRRKAFPATAYNADAVNKEIAKDKRIKGKEARAIHALLKSRTVKGSK